MEMVSLVVGAVLVLAILVVEVHTLSVLVTIIMAILH